jgi:hypothetical protein
MRRMMMGNQSVVGLRAANFFGFARVRKAWDRVLDLFTFIVGFASLLAPGGN